MELHAALRLYAITDARPAGELPGAVAAALRGGATMIQYRAKGLDDRLLLATALQLKQITDAFGVPLIINDRTDLAIAAGAAGAHLGPGDGDLSAARIALGRDRILGATARSVEQALAAQAAGADYLGSGAVFGTSTKADAAAMPLPLLREICRSVTVPVVAIGGIDGANIARLRGCGAAGVAVVSGIFGAADVEAAARALRAKAGELL
ncbi:MAG: thiamine phosphate synthase [Oscillospiraceae bacterium]|jgi:thiamine-phosphate diphosphorylase|nr:thiamine phosphate synthase [Oscillospiraceae bacterium]